MSCQRFNLGLAGFPLGHSLSPVLHKAALAACHLEGNYRLFSIEPGIEAENKLKALCKKVSGGDLRGFNVTIPHKQTILTCLDEVSSVARAIGAVNTVYMKEGKVCGENTDVEGFRRDLANLIPLENAQNALVLGAGGAARAIVYALVSSGWKVFIAARRLEQAEQLSLDFHSLADKDQILPLLLEAKAVKTIVPNCALIVNATPVGMSPGIDCSPWPVAVHLPEGSILYDLIYNPTETRLMKEAKMAHLTCQNGLGMLIEQAALAFEIWTGQIIQRGILQNALSAHLERTSRREA